MYKVSIEEAQASKINFDKFIEENLGLVRLVVHRYHGRTEFDESFQVGCIGLIKATRRFDVSLKVKFATYAVPMIHGEIQRYWRDCSLAPRRMLDLSYKAYAAIGNGRTYEELAAELKVSVEKIKQAEAAAYPPSSLEDAVLISTRGDNVIVKDILEAGVDVADEVVSKISYHEKMASLKRALPSDKYRQVLYLCERRDITQKEIGIIIGVSQCQVSRMIRLIREKYADLNDKIESGVM
jgi:RNA polymerase sporulation-specific sigma factor